MTLELVIHQIDAFSDRPFGGNPAAVMPLSDWLDDVTLQAIAAENNLAETAFIIPAEGDADYELRWFTPAIEVALCGHATLASGHFVLGLDPDRDTVRFRTRKAGILTVRRDGQDYAMDLPSYPPEPVEHPAFVAALGCDVEAVLRHPNGYLLAVLASAEQVRAVRPDFRALAAIGDTLDIVTAAGGSMDGVDVVSRVFAPAAGIDEDPVTGSAHCVLAPYWAGRLGRDSFTAWQASARGGHVACRVDGDRVTLGGSCVTVIEGVFRAG